MGVTDLDAKVALAESKQSCDAYVELLQYVRKEKLRAPLVVAKFGKLLVQSHSWRLGSDSALRRRHRIRSAHRVRLLDTDALLLLR